MKTVGYGYDAAGNQTRLTYPDASFVTYAFDELGRMTEVRDGGVTLLALYAYDPLSRLTTTTYDNGAQTSHDYELDDDLTQVAQSYGAGSVTFDYLYNLVNQRTDTTVDDNAYLWFPDLGASNSYLSNELNQYDDVDGTLFTYDGNGNLTGDGVDTYLYDVENRLVTATTAQNTADYSYDPQGRRGEKDVDGTVTRYVYAGVTVIAEYDGLDQLQARYVPGLGIDKPVLMVRGATLSYYHYDGSGSVIAMTDVFGVVVEAYAFGPYGESADGDLIGNPYRYTGRRLDAETGLYYYRARYYSASLGRFLQADPAGYADGLNLYAYVRNDPLNFVDPFGLATQSSGSGSGARDLTVYVAGSLGGTTQLYRAVDSVELYSIVAAGGRFIPSPGGLEVKYFAGTLEGAYTFGVMGIQAGMLEPPLHIYNTQIPTILLPSTSFVTVDRGISVVTVPNDLLPSLPPATIVGVIPSVP